MSIHNYSGTVADTFTLGKDGPTVYQGETDPTVELGEAGDLFIRHGASPEFFQKVDAAWIAIANESDFSFIRSTVTRGREITADSNVNMISVIRNPTTIDSIDITIDSIDITIDAHAAEYTEVILPALSEGRTIIVKDETSDAGAYEVRVFDLSGEDIDGGAYRAITTTRGFMELIYSGGKWNVVGR